MLKLTTPAATKNPAKRLDSLCGRPLNRLEPSFKITLLFFQNSSGHAIAGGRKGNENDLPAHMPHAQPAVNDFFDIHRQYFFQFITVKYTARRSRNQKPLATEGTEITEPRIESHLSLSPVHGGEVRVRGRSQRKKLTKFRDSEH
jgi:hypothetical protein